jgi:hypothetical protein
LVTGPLSSITKDIKEAYQSKLNAANDAERIAADERINLLEARKSTILAAQSDPVERLVRIGFAIPIMVYEWKLILWDKVLSLGVTDNLSPELWQLFWIVIGGYFLDVTIRGTARIIKK